MLKCDINEVMEDIKEMTIKEKNKFLEKLNNELYDFALKVDDLRETINDEYVESVKKKLSESIQLLLTEKHWEDMVGFDGTGYLLKRDRGIQAWITLCFDHYCLFGGQSWSISVTTGLSNIENAFPDLVKKLGINNQSGQASISIPADEAALLPTLKRIVSAWCNGGQNNEGCQSNEKDV